MEILTTSPFHFVWQAAVLVPIPLIDATVLPFPWYAARVLNM